MVIKRRHTNYLGLLYVPINITTLHDIDEGFKEPLKLPPLDVFIKVLDDKLGTWKRVRKTRLEYWSLTHCMIVLQEILTTLSRQFPLFFCFLFGNSVKFIPKNGKTNYCIVTWATQAKGCLFCKHFLKCKSFFHRVLIFLLNGIFIFYIFKPLLSVRNTEASRFIVL